MDLARPKPSVIGTSLLVSVHTVAEAEAALEGGADVIDIKEPANGSLGRATDKVIDAIVAYIDRRRPISVALGELAESPALPSLAGVSFAKWGLSGFGKVPLWQTRWLAARAAVEKANTACELVLVAYADWQRAASPPVGALCQFACDVGGTLLIDTSVKEPGQTLLDCLSLDDLASYFDRCHRAGVRLALAGSLEMTQIPSLVELEPDFIAVRRAACTGGRTGAVSAERVRMLADTIGRRSLSGAKID